MQLSRRVQGQHAIAELGKGVAQSVQVQGGRESGARGGLVAAPPVEEAAGPGARRRQVVALEAAVGAEVVADVAEEADAVDQLHREEPLVAVRGQLVEGHEVRV